MSSHEALKIMQNFTAHTAFFAQYDRSVMISGNAAYVRSDTGLDAGALNICVPLTDTTDQALFDAALGYFIQKRRPAVMWVWDHLTAWRAYLQEHAVTLLASNQGMCAKPSDLAIKTEPPPELEILPVSSPQHVRHFGDVVSRAFGKAHEAPAAQSYYDRLAQTGFYADKRLKMFVGYANGKPVCTGTRLLDEDTAGIYSIAALPDIRGRGYGSAVFHHILQDIIEQRASLLTLKASPAGAGIYLKAGFKPVCEVFIYDNRNMVTHDHNT